MKMKVFNYSELHFFEGTFYIIHTLVGGAHECMLILFYLLSTVGLAALSQNRNGELAGEQTRLCQLTFLCNAVFKPLSYPCF